eukprot:6195807-Pleurochrysis_carterae.AAC.1
MSVCESAAASASVHASRSHAMRNESPSSQSPMLHQVEVIAHSPSPLGSRLRRSGARLYAAEDIHSSLP